jgi:hypothetical protein
MPNSDVLGLASFFGKGFAYISGKKGNICVANIGFMFINHLHFWFMDVEGGS